MISKELAEKIVAELPSASLRKAIEEQNWQFSDRDLFLIAAKYCKILQTRWALLAEIIEQADEEISSWAKSYLAYEQRVKEKFCEVDEKCVYVTCILYENNWDTYEVFQKFDNARLYCEMEMCEDSGYQGARIRKQCLGEYAEDDLYGECALNPEGEILEFSYTREKEKKCEGFGCKNCTAPCVDESYPKFPKFFDRYDIVSYVDFYGKTIYGFTPLGFTEHEAYVITLDGDIVDRYVNDFPFEKWVMDRYESAIRYLCAYQHQHIELHELERLTYEELPEEYKRKYDKVAADISLADINRARF